METTLEQPTIPIPKVNFKLMDESNKGKFIIVFDDPRLSSSITLSKGGYIDKRGDHRQYKGYNGEPEDIYISAPRFEVDLSTEQGKKMADHIRDFDIKKRFGTKCKIIDTTVDATERVRTKDDEYKLVEKVKPYLNDTARLTALALNLGGIQTRGITPQEVKEQVYDRITKDPAHVEKVLDDADFELKALILYGVQLKVIEEKNVGSFYYGSIYLGANMEQAVQWCRSFPNEYKSLVRDINKA